MAKMDFRWLVPKKLAGCSMPGMFADLASDLEELYARGVRLLVSLTETPLVAGNADPGLSYLHFPIEDMGVPQPRQTADLCRQISLSVASGRPAAVHCKAGIGRTGTILACCLVTEGRSPEEAIRTARRVNTSYIQTEGQEQFIRHYREHLLAGSEGIVTPAHIDTYPKDLPRLRLKLPVETDA